MSKHLHLRQILDDIQKHALKSIKQMLSFSPSSQITIYPCYVFHAFIIIETLIYDSDLFIDVVMFGVFTKMHIIYNSKIS